MDGETAVKVGRTALAVQHLKENNLAYLVACLIAHQMGILDMVFSYGSGICS